jgi:hypothetical protein
MLDIVSRLSCYQLFLMPFHTKSYVLYNAIELFRSGYLSGVLSYYSAHMCSIGRDGSVGIATRYGLDGLKIESRWGASISSPVQTGPEAHPGTGSFPGVKKFRTGPRAYASDALQPVGLLWYPCTILVF